MTNRLSFWCACQSRTELDSLSVRVIVMLLTSFRLLLQSQSTKPKKKFIYTECVFRSIVVFFVLLLLPRIRIRLHIYPPLYYSSLKRKHTNDYCNGRYPSFHPSALALTRKLNSSTVTWFLFFHNAGLLFFLQSTTCSAINHHSRRNSPLARIVNEPNVYTINCFSPLAFRLQFFAFFPRSNNCSP